jgi:hypothetical protein
MPSRNDANDPTLTSFDLDQQSFATFVSLYADDTRADPLRATGTQAEAPEALKISTVGKWFDGWSG